MKTNKFFTTLASISFVLFLSFSSGANTAINYTGDITKASVTKNITSVNTVSSGSVGSAEDNDFSYLRFNVNNFISYNDNEEVTYNSLDYLRFEDNDYISANEPILSELPAINEYDYLRFDVNHYTTDESDDNIELPVNEYNYLRFDVNNYVNPDNSVINELPGTE